MERSFDRARRSVQKRIGWGVGLLAAAVAAQPIVQAATPADQVIFEETFERGFPGARWHVLDQNSASGLDTWGVVECRDHSGSASAWCRGSTRQDCSQYDGGMEAVMDTVQGLDLDAYTGAQLTYWRWYNLPETGVTFSLYVRDESNDWEEIKTEKVTGGTASAGWVQRSVSLGSYGAGFRMRFLFTSLTVPPATEEMGVYVDDIEIAGCPILGQAVALSPIDSASICSGQSQAYCWNAVPGASSYSVQWDETTTPPPIGEAVTTDTCISRTLSGTGVRFWRVRAETSCSQGAWSDWAVCVLVPVPGKPTLVSPEDPHEVCSGVSLRYDWSSVADATAYTIQWDKTFAFPAPIEAEVTTSQIDQAIVSTPETWYWRVRAKTGLCAGPWSEHRRIEVKAVPPQVALDTPADGESTCSGTPVEFDWFGQASAYGYDIQWADNPGFTGGGVLTGSTSSTMIERTLNGYGTWYWRVRGYNPCGNGPWSSARTIELGIVPAAPALQSPADGQSLCSDQTQDYCWSASTGASLYRIQWGDTSAFDHLTLQATTSETCASRALSGTGTRYWRVRAESACGNSSWSEVRSFNLVVLSQPAKTVLLGPADRATVCSGVEANYCWEPTARAQRYRVQWDDSSDFGFPLETTTVSLCRLRTITDTGRWYWRVRGENVCFDGPWSDVRQVNVVDLTPFHCLGISWTAAGQLSVSWEEQTCASAYTVEINTDLANPTGWIPIPPVTQWPVSGGSWTGPLPAGLKRGFVRVRAER